MSEKQNKCAYQYTVQRGDSFYLIAQKFNVSLHALLQVNEGIPPSRLTVGDVLCIPYKEDVNAPAKDERILAPILTPSAPIVEQTEGENVQEEIREEITPPVQEEDQETPLCPNERIGVLQQGQTVSDLQLQYDLSYHTLDKANDDLEDIQAGERVCIPAFNVPCPLDEKIVLQENQSLESIAITYDLPISALLKANPCLAPSDFFEGVTVKLPKS